MNGPPQIEAIAADLLAWYDVHGRDLPWRRDPAPYHTLLSEFMLQQTQVRTVLPYYERFLREWPSIESLAEASIETLRDAWAGLGYYRRIENLHRCAKAITEQHQGQIPKEPKVLKTLPGIGEYTAGAIAAIGYQKRCPAIDGNILRILSRVYAYPFQSHRKAARDCLASAMYVLMPEQRPGDFVQALMDLGQGPCAAKDPHCEACPLSKQCLAHAKGVANDYPLPVKKKTPRKERRHYLLLRHGKKLFLRKRQERLLHQFDEPLLLDAQDISGQVVRLIGQDFKLQPLYQGRHVFTHRIWELVFYESSSVFDPQLLAKAYPEYRFVDPSKADLVRLPVFFQEAFARYLSSLPPLC